MKKIGLIFIAVLCSTWQFKSAAANDAEIILRIEDLNQEPERGGEPSKGHRMPSSPMTCTIDFENYHIESTIPYEVVTYELWDEDGSAIITSYPSDFDLVKYMSEESGFFQLRLVTSEQTYAGFLEL